MYARHRYPVHHESSSPSLVAFVTSWLRAGPCCSSLYKQVHILKLHLTASQPGKQEFKKQHAMASISKFLLLLLCSYLTLVAHAADDRRHKVLSVGSLKSAATCSEAKGAVMSMNAPAIPVGYSIFVSVVIVSHVWTGCFSDSIIQRRRHGAVAPPARPMLACTLQEDAHLGGEAPA